MTNHFYTRSGTTLSLLVFLLCMTAVLQLNAQSVLMVDHFTNSEYTVSPPGLINDAPATGVLGGLRDVQPFGNGVMSQSFSTSYLQISPKNGGIYNVGWGNNDFLGGSDLNLNLNGYTQMEFAFTRAPYNQGALMTVRFNRPGDPDYTTYVRYLTGPGNYSVALSSLATLNKADIDGITVSFSDCVADTLIRLDYVHFTDVAVADTDSDGIPDNIDNCINIPNPTQTDSDGDGIGDACDNCLSVANQGQSDSDNDGRGDVCDNCPNTPNANQVDSDGDGIGDACDPCDDRFGPSITCPANINVGTTPEQCGAVVTFANATAMDNCAGFVVTQTAGIASGGTFPVGTTTNTFRVTDSSGHTATCAFTVTVSGTQMLDITCPANITQSNSTNQCSTTVTFTNPTATDNCPGTTVTQTAGLASGSNFPVGTTTNVFRATDAAGNTKTCSFNVTVNDTQAPTITCPANITLNNVTNQCSAPATFANATTTDNCSGVTVSQTAGLASGASFPVGLTTNTFRATDAAGNTNTCSFTVRVNDTQAPSITCPANTTIAAGPDCSGVVGSYLPLSDSDNCGVTVVLQNGNGAVLNGHNATQTVTLTASTGRLIVAAVPLLLH